MKSLKEQIANKCIYFNGVMNKQCEAGVTYSEIRVENENGPYMFPCLKQGGECSCAKFRSEEDVDEYIKMIEEGGAKAMIAMLAIKDHYARTKEQTGKIPCQCGGQLHYTVASVNGHVWAKCNSCAISFNE